MKKTSLIIALAILVAWLAFWVTMEITEESRTDAGASANELECYMLIEAAIVSGDSKRCVGTVDELSQCQKWIEFGCHSVWAPELVIRYWGEAWYWPW